jgi:hypothetical protein
VEANCSPSFRRPIAVTCHMEASVMPSACSSKSLHSSFHTLVCTTFESMESPTLSVGLNAPQQSSSSYWHHSHCTKRSNDLISVKIASVACSWWQSGLSMCRCYCHARTSLRIGKSRRSVADLRNSGTHFGGWNGQGCNTVASGSPCS